MTSSVVAGKTNAEVIRKKGLPFNWILFKFIKGLINSSILFFPMLFKDLRPLFALVFLFSMTFVFYFSMNSLVKGAQYHYNRLKLPSLAFGDLAEESCKVSFELIKNYGPLAKTIVNMITIGHQFGICSVFYLSMASNLSRVFGSLSIFEGNDRFWWFGIIFLPLVAFNSIVTTPILSVMCLIGNWLMFTCLALVLYKSFAIIVFDGTIYYESTGSLVRGTTPCAIFKACGLIIISCFAQSLVLPLENKIKKPTQMLGHFGILSFGIVISTIVYAVVGLLGYLAYGDTLGSAIIDHLECVDNQVKLNIVTHAIRFSLVLSIFASFMLQMFVIVSVLWPPIDEKITHLPRLMRSVIQFCFRACLVSACLVIGYSVPSLASFISLIGVTTGSLLAFVLPATFDLLTFVPLLRSQSRFFDANIRLGLNLLTVIFGITIMVGGVTVNAMAFRDEVWKCVRNGTTTDAANFTMTLSSFAITA